MTNRDLWGSDPANPFDSMVPTYKRWVHPVSTDLAQAVIPRLGLSRGVSLLDAGAGLGNLAVPASAQGVAVHAIDTSPAMVAELRERLAFYPQSHAELKSLFDLTPEPPGFDATVSLFCAVFLPDARDALERLVRVTRSGGTVCINSWANKFGAPMFDVLHRALLSMGVPDAAPTSPGLIHLSQAANLKQMMIDAGCREVAIETVELTCPLPPPHSFLDELDGLFRIVPAYNTITPAMRSQLQAEVAKRLQSVRQVDGTYRAVSVANVAFGTAP